MVFKNTEINVVITEKKLTVNAITLIVTAIIFFILGVIIPITGIHGGFLYSDISTFFWDRQISNLWNISFLYEVLGGIPYVTGETSTGEAIYGTINSPYGLFYLALALYKYPFILLSVIGFIMIILQPIYVLLDKEMPKTLKRFAGKSINGFLLILIAITIQWLLFASLWFVLDEPKIIFNFYLLILVLIGIFIGCTGMKMMDIWGEYWTIHLSNWLKQTGFYLFVFFVVIFCTFPFIWTFVQSLIDATERASAVQYLPDNLVLNNYDIIMTIEQFQWAIYNSFIISSVVTILCIIIGASGGYALAKFNFKLKTGVLGLILSMTMFPVVVILIPLTIQYVFLKDTFLIELNNSYFGLLIPYITFNLPLTVFLLFNFFEEIPNELVKAARVDGATNFQVFRHVIFPLALPGVFTTAILVFIAAWNEFLFANLIMTSSNKKTIPVVMTVFTGRPPIGATFDPFLVMNAATIVVTLPLILLVLIFQRQIIAGITAGAVKG